MSSSIQSKFKDDRKHRGKYQSSSIFNAISEIKSATLPKRLIVSGCHNQQRSYGLALFIENPVTNQLSHCAMIMRRFSFTYLNILRGCYRNAYLGDMISGLTRPEFDKLKLAITKEEINEKFIRIEGNNFVYEYNEYDFNMAIKMLKITQNRFVELLNKNPPEMIEEWTLPKGRPIENETPIETAIRECEEELGVKLTPDLITGQNVVESYISPTNGVTYITTYWPVIVKFNPGVSSTDMNFFEPKLNENERGFVLPKVTNQPEVCQRMWFSLDQLTEKFSRKITIETIKKLAALVKNSELDS
jgi:8-oxo-dGTP pyrophosphatase MutT (NUDIX family)